MTDQGNNVVDLIEEQAALYPERPAVISRIGETSYRELVSMATGISDLLLAKGICRETPVGVHFDRSLTWIAALLGVMRSGGVYVPVNPMSPLQRKARILEDACVRLLLTGSNCAAMVPRNIELEFLDDIKVTTSASHSRPSVTPGQAAYGICTSGSIAAPKHVVVTHESLWQYAHILRQMLATVPELSYLETASVEVSASMRQILVPLVSGGTLVLASHEEIRDPARLVFRMLQARITTFDTVPSYLTRWLEAILELPPDWRQALARSLRFVLTTGEPLRAKTANALHDAFPAVRIANLYGQTETAGTVAIHWIESPVADPIPIGPPLQGCGFHVLNDKLEPATEGELYISGPCLARGYPLQPSATAAAFIPDPFCGVPGSRMYRTGDRVRCRGEGTFEYMGRSDRQVKFHGIRIELGEIELALRGHGDVQDAAVVLLPAKADHEARLVAFVVLRPGSGSPEDSELRMYLSGLLGDSMTPGVIGVLDELPRTESGKVNYPELMVRDLSILQRHTSTTPLSTPTEQLVAKCWEDILQFTGVSAEDDFFALGGDSIQAMEMLFLLRKLITEPVPLGGLFFQDPTLKAFANAIDQAVKGQKDSFQSPCDGALVDTVPHLR